MSRLTRRAENGTAVYATPSGEPVKWENNRRKVLQKLAEYEDLEEQGLLLKLPFALGTKKLYLIDGYEIDELDATGITLYKADGNAIRPHETVIRVDYCDFYYYDFGKTVFLTKEEAEKELKRMECAE